MKMFTSAIILFAISTAPAFAGTALVTPSPAVIKQLSACGYVLPANVKVKETTATKIAAFAALKPQAACTDKATFVKTDEKFTDALSFTVSDGTVRIETAHQTR